MAFDGITVAAIVQELKEALCQGRIAKIAQPEADELLLTIKTPAGQKRLYLSASASLPLIYLTEDNTPSLMTAPNFCMLLRKHIGNGRIMDVSQPGLERIIQLDIEHLDELGDPCRKKLMVEIMGKHSNIIFCREDGTILDSIKHVSAQLSSVREVLPGRPYFIPMTVEKLNPLEVTEEAFGAALLSSPAPLHKALYQKLTGLSPIMGTEICHLASLDGDVPASSLNDLEMTHLYHTFSLLMEDVREGRFQPNIVYQDGDPVEFASLPLTCYQGGGFESEPYDSISALLEHYYSARSAVNRIKQKSVDLRKIVQNLLERNYKKYDLQEKQLKDTEKREKYRIYGELLNTYGYELAGGEKSFRCLNYYTGEEITIPLDEQLSPRENARSISTSTTN